MEDFEYYMQDPNRDPECELIQKWKAMTDGPPTIIFPKLLSL